MAANTGERTLISAIIPPGAAHADSIFAIGLPTESLGQLCVLAGLMTSLLATFAVRAAPKNNIFLCRRLTACRY